MTDRRPFPLLYCFSPVQSLPAPRDARMQPTAHASHGTARWLPEKEGKKKEKKREREGERDGERDGEGEAIVEEYAHREIVPLAVCTCGEN